MSKATDWDPIKRKAEAGREYREKIAQGKIADPLCRHFVARKDVEIMRMTGGATPCVKCGKMLTISPQKRMMPDGSVL